MQEGFEAKACDGFNVMPPIFPGGLPRHFSQTLRRHDTAGQSRVNAANMESDGFVEVGLPCASGMVGGLASLARARYSRV